jgi:tetratricopeptide (TPR) repeat protein
MRVTRRGLTFDDFRPGLPAEQFWAVFVRAADTDAGKALKAEAPRAISHVEQMHASRCFKQGQDEGRLSCVSCHDPHRRIAAAERVGFYRERCLACHDERDCAAPARQRQAKQDSCIDCHMQRYGAGDIPHTASTDHRILRHGRAKAEASTPVVSGPGPPLASYYRNRDGVTPEDDDRALALAVVRKAQRGANYAFESMPQALGHLDAALKRHPDDLDVLEARGYALGWRSRPAEALAAFEKVLEAAPRREAALRGAAAMAEALAKNDLAIKYWRSTVEANPVAPAYRGGLARMLIRNQNWDEALREADAWTQLDPFDPEARAARLTCLLHTGPIDAMQLEMRRVEALAPPNLQELRIRVETKLRGR